ncbi:GntR family transcriptional regulator, partial [Bradyrhizobium sp. SHOUNA76]|nr:GntR family transcriptional regulator [Bradyrhizobium sp. SHOUNA76]
MRLDEFPQGTLPTEPVVPRVDRPSASVQKVTRAEELRLQLADEIVRGALAPGAPLDETDI